MIIDTYDAARLHAAFGIDMSGFDGVGVGAGWGRVAPGRASQPQQHDEIETVVVVAGTGELVVDGVAHPAVPGTVAAFEPFETHAINNTGEHDLVFATFYWRDAARAGHAAGTRVRGRLDSRPVFVVSTPPTPNGDLHLGHLSGPYLGADAYVRFLRMTGVTAWHVTGSDDHQSYVVDRARRDGREPAAAAAHYGAEIAETLRMFDIDVDQYTATSVDPTYRDGLRAYFARQVASGQITVRPGPALFDADTGHYLYEVDVSGACPACGAGTGGNICEECGEPNVCADLRTPRATGSPRPPQRGVAARYAIDLPRLAPDVLAHHRLGRVPARLRELADRVLGRADLEIALTHPSGWGVPPAEDTVPGQVIWVWPEMAYGFLHGIERLGERLGHDWRADAPDASWKIVHFFGFDNSFYHAILYPVLYRLAYPAWTPDIDYHVNEFYLLDGEKFSTSRGHAVWGKEILATHGVDEVRYFLAANRPEGRRTNFRSDAFEGTVRDTLVGRWQRWLNELGCRVRDSYGGLAPDAGIWTPEQTAFLARLGARLTDLGWALGGDGFSLNAAATALDGLVAEAAAFADREHAGAHLAAWADQTRTAVALELAAARLLAHGAAPVMPRFAARLAAALGEPAPTVWPSAVTLVAPGNRITLADEVFFGTPAAAAGQRPARPAVSDEPAVLPWLRTVVRAALQLPEDADVDARTLRDLGAGSLHAVAIQYQVLDETGVDVPLDHLLAERDVASLARMLADLAPPSTPDTPPPSTSPPDAPPPDAPVLAAALPSLVGRERA
jgi:methionyl-tRNA synthetase